MTTPRPRVPWSRWSTKQYIIAALLGMLAMVAAAAAVSISLAPAQIAFSVRDASITHRTQQPLHFWYYNLTVVANNPSHRTAVSYGSLTVDIWRSETAWIPTEDVNVSAALPGWLRPGNTTLVKVGVEGGQYNEEPPPKGKGSPPPPSPTPAQGSSSNMAVNNSNGVAKWPDCRVVVEAKVRFRFAGVPTLPYTVQVRLPLKRLRLRLLQYFCLYGVFCSRYSLP